MECMSNKVLAKQETPHRVYTYSENAIFEKLKLNCMTEDQTNVKPDPGPLFRPKAKSQIIKLYIILMTLSL